MKKILILGSTGMMGSAISKLIKNDKRFKILCTYKNYRKVKLIKLQKNQKKKLNVFNFHETKKIILRFEPDFIINCVGLIKQLSNEQNINKTKFLNTILPKKLSIFAKNRNFRIIHLSTDCVF